MGFEDFLGAIESRALRDIVLHWDAARGAQRMPGWRNIDPAAIAPHLSIVWSWKYDKETDTFTGRLAGEVIVGAHGGNLRGKRMQDFFTGPRYAGIFDKYRRVVTEPAFARETGQVFRHASRHGVGERIIMPLADDGKNADGILGATSYPIEGRGSPDTPREIDGDQTDFFPLNCLLSAARRASGEAGA